jgi:hypothetical protein
MTHARTYRLLPLLILAVAAMGGCSKNSPCATDPSQIEAARAESQTAAQELAAVQTEVSAAGQQKADLTQQLGSLPDKRELEAKLEELKKGSGR